MIPYGRQDISQEDIDAVVEVLRSDFLTQGPTVPKFEEAVAGYVSVPHAVAVNSATSALHVACLALGLGPGDWLWTTPITFVASANCALYCNASVDFVDIDPLTCNISVTALETKLKAASLAGRLPKIVVPVHLGGQSADMQRIAELGREYGFRIIEDASHAIGGSYLGAKVGGCRYSDITVFSFHPVKIITTAEGGCATTCDDDLAVRMRLAASHGVTRDPALMTHAPDGDWYYQQVALGYNYRMTELQAALGLQQMKRLDQFVDARTERAVRYSERLVHLPLDLPVMQDGAVSAWHLYIIRLQLDRIAASHKDVFSDLRKAGIGVNLHYIPVHLQPFYRAMGFKLGDFPNAEAYYRRAMSIPIYPGLTEAAQDRVIAALENVLR